MCDKDCSLCDTSHHPKNNTLKHFSIFATTVRLIRLIKGNRKLIEIDATHKTNRHFNGECWLAIFDNILTQLLNLKKSHFIFLFRS